MRGNLSPPMPAGGGLRFRAIRQECQMTRCSSTRVDRDVVAQGQRFYDSCQPRTSSLARVDRVLGAQAERTTLAATTALFNLVPKTATT
jgi:hypothetical protein